MVLLMSAGSRYLFGEKPRSLLMHRVGEEVCSLAVITRGQSWLTAPELFCPAHGATKGQWELALPLALVAVGAAAFAGLSAQMWLCPSVCAIQH